MTKTQSAELLPQKPARVMIAGLGNWHFKDFSNAIADLGAEVSSCNSVPRFSGSADVWRHAALGLVWRAGLRLSGTSPMFFANPAIYHRMRAFDHFIETQVRAEAPDFLLAWTGMSKRSLFAAREIGATSFLIHSNSPLDIYEQRLCSALGPGPHIPVRWKDDQAEEYRQADRIVVESTYCAGGLKMIGVPADKIKILPPHVALSTAVTLQETVNFCHIQPNRRKGLKLLLDYWRHLDPAPKSLTQNSAAL